MSEVWQLIRQNFKDCLEDSVTGVNSLTSITNSLSESTAIDPFKDSKSNRNGKYFLSIENVNGVVQDLGLGLGRFDETVKMKIGYEFNKNDAEKEDYHNASKDVHEIIRKRLSYNTFVGSGIDTIDFVLSKGIQFPDKNSEQFGVVELYFRVKAQVPLL